MGDLWSPYIVEKCVSYSKAYLTFCDNAKHTQCQTQLNKGMFEMYKMT